MEGDVGLGIWSRTFADAGARRATYKPWTSPAPDRTIDHAFCSPGAAFAGGRVEATDGYLSDHQPVVFEVSFNKT